MNKQMEKLRSIVHQDRRCATCRHAQRDEISDIICVHPTHRVYDWIEDDYICDYWQEKEE